MATKKCANGHLYDSSIYGDKCPFCPSGATKVNTGSNFDENRTKPVDNEDPTKPVNPTVTVDGNGKDTTEGNTVFKDRSGTDGTVIGKKLVGLLISYSANPAGEVYKVYEGRTTIGRSSACDLSFPKDQHMSGKHLLIQYVEAKGAFRAQDQGSSNGSFVNGQVYMLGDVVDLKTSDMVVLGGTKFLFIAIPEF